MLYPFSYNQYSTINSIFRIASSYVIKVLTIFSPAINVPWTKCQYEGRFYISLQAARSDEGVVDKPCSVLQVQSTQLATEDNIRQTGKICWYCQLEEVEIFDTLV